MSSRVEFFQDHDNSLKKKIEGVLNNRNALPKQIFENPTQYYFYFGDFYDAFEKPFIHVLHELGRLLDQSTFKIFVPGYYYYKTRFKIERKKKIPYAKMDIRCSEEDYVRTVDEPIENGWITMSTLYNFYWYFNPKCLIYGDKESEVIVLALDKSFLFPPVLQNTFVPVETFVKQHEDMNLEPGVDVDEFKKALVENYHNGK